MIDGSIPDGENSGNYNYLVKIWGDLFLSADYQASVWSFASGSGNPYNFSLNTVRYVNVRRILNQSDNVIHEFTIKITMPNLNERLKTALEKTNTFRSTQQSSNQMD